VGMGAAARPSMPGPRGLAARNSRDPRPVGDRVFAAQCARNVVELLMAHSYGKLISYEKLLRDPSTKDFYDIFRFLIAQIDPQLEVEGKLEDEVPAIMRRLKYPVEVNRSKLQAISGPNTWPQLLAVLDWLANLVRLNDELVAPLAECQASLSTSVEHDDGDFHIMRTLHENYMQFLSGRDDHSDEERLRQIYEERIDALKGEIQRLRDHHSTMEQRLQAFHAEQDRLAELQKAPATLGLEVEGLQSAIFSAEARVQRMDAEIASVEAEEKTNDKELEDLQALAKQLTEQVMNQAYSKKEVERLKNKRAHLQEVQSDLRAESERVDQGVWELNMQESRRVEGISRVVRQVNEAIENLDGALLGLEGGCAQDLAIRLDLCEPSDTLAAQDFSDLRACAQASTVAHHEEAQSKEAALQETIDEQQMVQENLTSKDREIRRLRERLEQLNRMREEYREWSAKQLDEAQRTAEATEDSVHAVSIGTSAPVFRDAAEIDKLKLTLSAIQTQGAQEIAQMEEQLQRDEEKLEDHRQSVLQQLDMYHKDIEAIAQNLGPLLDGDATQMRRAARASQGGC